MQTHRNISAALPEDGRWALVYDAISFPTAAEAGPASWPNLARLSTWKEVMEERINQVASLLRPFQPWCQICPNGGGGSWEDHMPAKKHFQNLWAEMEKKWHAIRSDTACNQHIADIFYAQFWQTWNVRMIQHHAVLAYHHLDGKVVARTILGSDQTPDLPPALLAVPCVPMNAPSVAKQYAFVGVW